MHDGVDLSAIVAAEARAAQAASEKVRREAEALSAIVEAQTAAAEVCACGCVNVHADVSVRVPACAYVCM